MARDIAFEERKSLLNLTHASNLKALKLKREHSTKTAEDIEVWQTEYTE